jgi:hypothetical protein
MYLCVVFRSFLSNLVDTSPVGLPGFTAQAVVSDYSGLQVPSHMAPIRIRTTHTHWPTGVDKLGPSADFLRSGLGHKYRRPHLPRSTTSFMV